MNGDFFNYQNKQEYPVWHAWRGDEIQLLLLLLLLLTLWGKNLILMFVMLMFYNSNGDDVCLLAEEKLENSRSVFQTFGNKTRDILKKILIVLQKWQHVAQFTVTITHIGLGCLVTFQKHAALEKTCLWIPGLVYFYRILCFQCVKEHFLKYVIPVHYLTRVY